MLFGSNFTWLKSVYYCHVYAFMHNCMHMHVLSVSAQDFEYDSLYICWFVDLPTGWLPASLLLLCGHL